MKFEVIESVEALRELYDAPMELAVKKQRIKLDKYSMQFLSHSPFSVLSTSNASGDMDCSPRGDHPGFIQALDETTVVIPDRPGNNRLDSLTNIIANPNIGILVFVPGFNECLRINGAAKIATNTELLEQFEYQGKLPKSVIVVSIKEVYFHCAKALIRSNLWKTGVHVDRDIMPSLGRILMEQLDPSKSNEEIMAVEALIADREKATLY